MDEKKERKILIIVLIVLAIVLLTPLPVRYKDGGTVEYKALLYSVTKRHSWWYENDVHGFKIGIEISIFGIEIFENVHFEPLEENS